MASFLIATLFSAFFFSMYMKANSNLKRATEDTKEIWSFLRMLMLVFLAYFFGAALWTAAYLVA